jgi:long-subunit fatty acid transport protein
MKGIHNFKTGVELRMIPQLALRVGYNYVSSPFERSAYLNHFLDSDNYYYATNTDYVNLSETHRVSCGLGFTYKKFTADCAYVYQMQHADVYAFHLPHEHSNKNRLDAARVDLNQHKFMLTLGYKF